MNNSASKLESQPSEKQIQKSLAVLIKNTRTTRRYLSLVEIADWLNVAIKGLGSIKEVADRIDLSPKMLKQFTYINKLIPEVQEMFAKRKIDSVDIAVHLSMLNRQEQLLVAEEVAAKQLDSADVRAIRELRNDASDLGIKEVIERVKSSRNVKHYIAEFIVRSKKLRESELRKRFSRIIESENIIKLTKHGPIGRITMNEKGKQLLQQYSNRHGFTKAEAVSMIVRGDVD